MNGNRQILYVPILHAKAEVALIEDEALTEGGGKKAESHTALLEMWKGIQQKLEELKPVWEKVQIYQEALPVCGKERKIVESLAEKGSQNHRLILELLKKGCSLEGTEDPNLLLREYDLLSRAFQDREQKRNVSGYQAESEKVLQERDRFIAARIRETLKDGGTGLLFIGVRHKVDPLLKNEFPISYVIYRVPFGAVKTIYNL